MKDIGIEEIARRGELLRAFELPIALTNGNDGRGGKWFSSAKSRKKFEKQLASMHWRDRYQWPIEKGVIVHVVRVIPKGGRKWDSSSCGRGNWKEIEDSLVSIGMFKDDSSRYIDNTFYFQDASERPLKGLTRVFVYKTNKEEVAK